MTVFRPVHPGHETNWVGSFSSEEEERWLRVGARMPLDSPHETQNSTSRLRFHISGDGHETSAELPREPSPSDAPGATPEADPSHGSESPGGSAADSPELAEAGTDPEEAHAQGPDGSHRPASPCSRWWEPVCSLSWWGELFSAARRR